MGDAGILRIGNGVSCPLYGDYEQPAALGERGQDLLGHAVGKVLLLRIGAHVCEQQHGCVD